MTLFRLRVINMGRVVQEDVIEAANAMEAWREAHPDMADPLYRARRGLGVAWAEVSEVREGRA